MMTTSVSPGLAFRWTSGLGARRLAGRRNLWVGRVGILVGPLRLWLWAYRLLAVMQITASGLG